MARGSAKMAVGPLSAADARRGGEVLRVRDARRTADQQGQQRADLDEPAGERQQLGGHGRASPLRPMPVTAMPGGDHAAVERGGYIPSAWVAAGDVDTGGVARRID